MGEEAEFSQPDVTRNDSMYRVDTIGEQGPRFIALITGHCQGDLGVGVKSHDGHLCPMVDGSAAAALSLGQGAPAG